MGRPGPARRHGASCACAATSGAATSPTATRRRAIADLQTLDLLRQYRAALDTTEPLAFGVYGEVREPGRVAVGDAVALTPR